MNILITGAGLIGANAARHAVDAGHKVVLFDLSPNRDYIHKVAGKDKTDVVAADMRDLPALLSAMARVRAAKAAAALAKKPVRMVRFLQVGSVVAIERHAFLDSSLALPSRRRRLS